ncbi:MAG: alpha/beta hydrolase [Bdellovibrionales bacterium]|nr:alpha/beta hydrolase [Bdellovibrionales bacterium]
MKTNILNILFILLFSLPSFSKSIQDHSEDYIALESGIELYVKHWSATNDQPTIVLINGLTYSTHEWDAFIQSLHKINPDIGILTFDMRGMGKTLSRNLLKDFLTPDISSPFHQADDLYMLLEKMNIQTPLHLMGLSYGGGVAQAYMSKYGRSQGVQSSFLVAPLITPVPAQMEWVSKRIKITRALFPFLKISEQDLFAFYFRQLVYSTFPMAEPIVLEHPFKLEGVYRLALAARHFNGHDLVELHPDHSIHFIAPTHDEYITQEEFRAYWEGLPKKKRGSLIYLENVRHKAPEEAPALLANVIFQMITSKDKKYFKGQTFSSRDFEKGLCLQSFIF